MTAVAVLGGRVHGCRGTVIVGLRCYYDVLRCGDVAGRPI